MRQPRVRLALLLLLPEHEALRQESTTGSERVRGLQETKRRLPVAFRLDSENAGHLSDKMCDLLQAFQLERFGTA